MIVVAEGAGQDLMAGEERRDASGNILKKDIGTFLKAAIEEHFKAKGEPITVKYFDPSIRQWIASAPCAATDRIE